MAAWALDFEKDNAEYAIIADGDQHFGGLTAFSICFWAKLETVGVWQEAIAKDNYSTRCWIVSMYNNNFRIYVFNGGTHGNSGSAPSGLTPGTWYWVYLEWDKATVQTPRLYINNVLISTTGGAVQANTMNNATLQLALGANSAGVNPFDGVLDSIGIFNRILTPAERATIYNGGVGAQIPSGWSGLLGAWELDEGTGTTFADTLGNHDGAFSANAPTWVTGHVPVPPVPAPPAGPSIMGLKTAPTGYHCFIQQYIKNMFAGFLPLKLPDGTLW